jgi:chromosome condensin MukBEF ATPase and DNA-binding subunit MukB
MNEKLPWSYVSRRAFLEKRKQNLQRQLADLEPRLKDQLDKWDLEKKYTEQALKNDAAKLARYMDNTYKPAIEREKQNYQRASGELTNMINRVDEQLRQPAAELEKIAIVKRNPSNANEYLFTDKDDPFAQIPTKLNPAYFQKGLPHSVPQFISVEIIYNNQNTVHEKVAGNMADAIDFDYLKSFIGKTTPAAPPSGPLARIFHP